MCICVPDITLIYMQCVNMLGGMFIMHICVPDPTDLYVMCNICWEACS